MMTIIGYARVSTDGQSLDAQRAALKSAGCAKIFAEKQSGVVTGRKELVNIITSPLKSGDLLYMITVCPTDEYPKYQQTFLNILRSVTAD